MNTNNQQPMTRVQQSVLHVKRQAFANSQMDLAEQLRQGVLGSDAVERTINAAVDLIEGLEVANSTPKHLHGDRHDVYHQQQIRPEGDFVHNQVVNRGNVAHHTTELSVATEKLYKLSSDLIVSTNGQFVFRPVSQKLILAVGEIDLSENEVARLLGYLQYDFNI